MRILGRMIAAGALAATLATAISPVAFGCSPPFEKPSIRGLGPAPVILLGTTGERVSGGRLFHVERAWNIVATTPIVIAFMEGEPSGDCSYLVTEGEHLIMAPDRIDGVLAANLVTLQADPASDVGRRYLADAGALYGPGIVPETAVQSSVPGPVGGSALPDLIPLVAGLLGGLAMFGLVIVIARRQQVRRSPD